MTVPEKWRQEYEIKVYESDALGRANLPSLCDYFQDMAWRHYTNVEKALGALLAPKQIWMMVRLEINIERLPKWQDVLEIETWSRGIERMMAYRDFTMEKKDGTRFAAGTSTWVVMDTNTGRIARLNNLAQKWPSVPGRSSIGKSADKVEDLNNPVFGKPFEVRYSDMDVNRHVNNVEYIKWMFDAPGMEFLESHTIKRAVINFMDEAKAGEEVKAGFEKASETSLKCTVLRLNDGREVSRGLFEFV
ncbi:MAG: hypothetical protein LLG37_07080 [Spirochaetia bacterium]|nr:hypothetical protein [Spirochaetia bacterium]